MRHSYKIPYSIDRSRHVDAAAILERYFWHHSPVGSHRALSRSVHDCSIFRISDYGEWRQVYRYNMADGLRIAAHRNSR